jgi:methylthioribulose-1-phosphate dehydratase
MPSDHLPASQLSDQDLATALARAGRSIHARGWVPATSGNFSVRLADGSIAVTRSGIDKSALESGDIMRLKADGSAADAGTPSAETALHLQLYGRDPAIGAVLHTHSMNAVLAGRGAMDEVEVEGLELLKALDGYRSHESRLSIPVFDNDQDIGALARRVETRMERDGQGHAYLIRGHGLYTWGRDLPTAMRHLEALEYLLEYCRRAGTI